MKKKPIIIAFSVFVAVAIVALVTFVFSDNPIDEVKILDLNGTWKVAAYFSNGTPMLCENEFMTFDENRASAYRDGLTIATSKYTLTGGTNLELSDLSRKYTVERRTDNYIRLYESKNVYMELIRYPNGELNEAPVDTSKLYDRWNVAYRNTDNPVADEVIAFSENIIEDYRDGSTEPIAVSHYSWPAEGCLFADKWGIEFELIQPSNDIIFFVETHSGLIWELHRFE